MGGTSLSPLLIFVLVLLGISAVINGFDALHSSTVTVPFMFLFILVYWLGERSGQKRRENQT